MKKIILLFIALMLAVAMPLSVFAAKNDSKEEPNKEPIKVYIFKGETCGYCARALAFFESIEEEYGKYFDLVQYEVWYDENNKALMDAVANYFGEDEHPKYNIFESQKKLFFDGIELNDSFKNNFFEENNLSLGEKEDENSIINKEYDLF